MTRFTMHTRLALIVLAALLVLPMTQTASPVAAKNRARIVTRTFSNPAPIPIPLAASYPASATLYPSPIVVKGAKGVIRDGNVRPTDISHDDPDEVQVLLVGPGGKTAIVMANVGGEDPVAGVTLRLDDEAAEPLTNAMVQSGAYRPTNGTDSTVAFNAPAPPVRSANAALATFDGADPNGTWRLFVQDKIRPSDAGVFAGGWELVITAKGKGKRKQH